MSDLDEMLKAAGISDGTGESVDPDTFRSGFVTLVGRPNAGKSTLLNHIMGEKLAITSRTPQTTRHRFRAVYDTGDMQMIIVDTPGIHKPKDVLGEELNESALQALADVDVIAFLIDASQPVGIGDEWIANHVNELSCGKILVISKADLVKKPVIAERLEQARGLCDFDAEVVVSAKHNRGLDDFVEAVYDLLPTGPRWFPKDTGVDLSDEVLIAEFIREKILRSTFDEVPHSVGVVVEEIERIEDRHLMRIWAVIYVERDSQKGIIIGAKGSKIKQIGTQAREDLERIFGCQVHLDLTVKVKKDWRQNAAQVRKFGYGEGL